MRGHPCELRDGRFHERSEIFQSGEFLDEQFPSGELRDEREQRRMDRGEKHLMAFWAMRCSDGEPVEPEDGSRDAPAKSERRVREWRTEDGTVPFVLVSALAILFACEADARLRREKFLESVNLRREPPAGFAERRARNCFSGRIHFSSLRFARGLPESECSGA